MIETMILYATSFIGTPYKWGGNNPLEGFDCSGFVLEVLKSGGIILDDQTSQRLYYSLSKLRWHSELTKGSILFFGENITNITHTAIALNNHVMIEAGGGTSKTKSYKDAIRDNAFVRIRPIRHDLLAALKPNTKGIIYD